jgi:metal-responsive CopG/Arc/MetJ family transcriptional regulator
VTHEQEYRELEENFAATDSHEERVHIAAEMSALEYEFGMEVRVLQGDDIR